MRRAIAVAVAVPTLALGLSACGAEGTRTATPPRLPAGVTDATTGVLYSARIEPRGALTRVRGRPTRAGRPLRAATVPGRWVIPVVAGDDLAGTLSGDGGTLTPAGPRGAGTGSFRARDTRPGAPPP